VHSGIVFGRICFTEYTFLGKGYLFIRKYFENIKEIADIFFGVENLSEIFLSMKENGHGKHYANITGLFYVPNLLGWMNGDRTEINTS